MTQEPHEARTPRAPVFYTEIKMSPSPEDPRRLVFVAAPGSPKLPDDLLTLRQGYETASRIVSLLFRDATDKRRELFNDLHLAADRGLRGPNFNVEDGRANLSEMRQIITDSAQSVRDQFFRQYLKLMFWAGGIPLLLGAVVLLTDGFGVLNPPAPGEPYDPSFVWSVAPFWITAGASICVWGEFALRMQGGLSYEQLLRLDPSRWRPGQRVTIAVGISFILAFFLAFNAVQIGIGGILLNDFSTTTPALSLAVGGVTGLAFPAVRDVIFRLGPQERE